MKKEKIAETAIVNFGYVSLKGYRHPVEGYGIPLSELWKLLLLSNKHEIKGLLPVLPKDFKFRKWKTEEGMRSEKIIIVEELGLFLVDLAMAGYKPALAFVGASAMEVLDRRFNDSFQN